jgi:tRNA (cytidine/uridine-2'-O-)-methyltransferase
MIRIALYQPDIPQNVGAMMRLTACLGVKLDIVEPCGFPWDERKIRQAGMDYMEFVKYTRHENWNAFRGQARGRIILMTTKAALPYTDFRFEKNDTLLAGRESGGVPDEIHESADAGVCIPMQPGLRSLNIVNAAAMITGEALRQCTWQPDRFAQNPEI